MALLARRLSGDGSDVEPERRHHRARPAALSACQTLLQIVVTNPVIVKPGRSCTGLDARLSAEAAVGAIAMQDETQEAEPIVDGVDVFLGLSRPCGLGRA